jgi:photosystem II stability/assembly factor-like uncharacterized protein
MIEQPLPHDIVYAIAASPDFAQDGLCFAARASGLFRSTDGGHTWHNAYDSLNLNQALTTAAVAFSPIFTADQTVFAGVSGGILRSIDGGQTWSAVSLPTPPPFVSVLAVSPNFAQDGVVFAGTLEDGVFRSGDRGQHWAAWNFGLLDLNVLALAISPDFANDETLFVGAESGIYRSANGGRAWREVDFPMDYAPVLSLAISPHYASDGILWAGTEAHGLFRSNDRGRTWQPVGPDTITEAVNIILLTTDFPAQPGLLVMSGNALLESGDGGQTWTDRLNGSKFDHDLAAVTAPLGIAPAAPLLVGLMDGSVRRV